MAGRGGPRPGAGRKPGSANKLTHKAKATLGELAGKYTQDALRVLAEIMMGEGHPSAARVSAANSLLDRAHGKPMQVMPGGDDASPAMSITITSAAPVKDVRVTRSDG